MAEEVEGLEEGLEDQEPKKPGKVVPILVAVICLAAGGAVGAKALGPTVGTVLAERAASGGGGGGHGGGHGGGEESTLHVVDNLVVNPAESGGGRFLLTSIALQTHSPDDAAMLATRDVELRDAMLLVLGSKTVEELSDITLRPAIAEELVQAAERVVGPHVVARLFIPQFVIQ